jgi:hypothetical protein
VGVQRFNRSPKLVDLVRRTRERALGGDDFVDHLSTARGRPADRAARQLVALRGDAAERASPIEVEEAPLQRQGRAAKHERLRDQPRSRRTMTSTSSS